MPSKKLPVLTVQNFKKPELGPQDFYVKTFQEHRAVHPFVMKPHRHDFYMIMLFTEGSGKHTIDTTTFDIEPGAIFFMSPGEMHAWSLSDNTNGFVIMFHASFFILRAHSRQITESPFFSVKQKLRYAKLGRSALNEYSNLLKTIYRESTATTTNTRHVLRNYLDILLLKLADALPTQHISQPGPAGIITQLDRLIELNYYKHLPVSFYAKELAISASQLNHIMSTYLNQSISDLVRERLLLEAKRLLIYTTLSIFEISMELGFNDDSYFARFFKKNTGQTPEQFRKQLIVP
jgi:AraC family transcriptional regulator, transcriptional activator of pobA